MSSTRALKKNVDRLIKSVKKSEDHATPWKGIDKVQEFLVKHRNDLTSHAVQLSRVSEIQERQVEEVALNLHHLSKSVCLNLDEFDHLQENDSAPPSHVRCTNFVNRTAQFIIKDILGKRGMCQRTLRMEFWIAVLHTVFKQGDLQAAGIILTALNNADICKLTATYKGLSPQAQNVLTEMREFAFTKRSLIVEERTTPIVPAFDGYMRHFIASRYSNDQKQLVRYKKELQKLQAELQFSLIEEVICQIIAEPKLCIEHVERWVRSMAEAYAKKNYRKVLIILNALNSDEVKHVTSDFAGVSFKSLHMIEEITGLMRNQPDFQFDSAHFVHLETDTPTPVYFDHGLFTSGDDIVKQNKFDKRARKSVKKLEPTRDLKPSPILHEHFPYLFFDERATLHLNKKVRNRLKQEGLNDEIMQINGDKLYQCLKWLEDYSRKQPRSLAGSKRKKKVDAILTQFEDVTTHVTYHAHKGVAPNIDENLRYLKEEMADPAVNRHGRASFIKKWRRKETVLAAKLNEFKEALEETKKLADEQAELVHKYNKRNQSQLSSCIDLMASLANMKLDIITNTNSSGMESGEQTITNELDFSTVVLTVSSSESDFMPSELHQSIDEGLEVQELASQVPQVADVPIPPLQEESRPTSNLVRFFETKAKRDSLAVLKEVAKTQRKVISEEINSFKVKALTSIFGESNRKTDSAEKVAVLKPKKFNY